MGWEARIWGDLSSHWEVKVQNVGEKNKSKTSSCLFYLLTHVFLISVSVTGSPSREGSNHRPFSAFTDSRNGSYRATAHVPSFCSFWEGLSDTRHSFCPQSKMEHNEADKEQWWFFLTGLDWPEEKASTRCTLLNLPSPHSSIVSLRRWERIRGWNGLNQNYLRLSTE